MPLQPDGDVVEENSRKTEEEQVDRNCKPWRERRTMEKSLWIMIGVLMVMFVIVLTFLIRSGGIVNTKVVKEKKICSTPTCIEEAFRLLKYGNYTSNSCNSFSEFACGFKQRSNSEDDFTYSDHHLLLVKKLLENHIDDDDVEATKAKKFYHSCINNEWSQSTNKTVRKLLKKAGLTNSASDVDTYRREKTLALFNVYRDKNPFFRFHRNHHIIYLYPGRPVLKTNVLLVDTNTHLLMRMKYENLINSILIELGVHPRDADKDAEELVHFEREFAEMSTRRCPNKPRQVNLERLEELFNEIKWSAIIKHIYHIYGLDEEFSENMKVMVICEKYLISLFHLLDKYGHRVVDNFLTWSFAVNYLPFLDPTFRYRFRQIEDAIDNPWSGNVYENNEKMCLFTTLYYFNAPISLLYEENELSEEEEAEIKEIFEDVQKAYEEIISEQEWLDENSKTQCKTMMREMDLKIGFTKQSDDPNIVSTMYYSVNVTDDIVENILAIDKAIFAEKIVGISWSLIENQPMDVDASYTPNILTLSFGTTLPPVYKMGNPRFLNYGTLGFIMAHKMSHAFLTSGNVRKILNKESFRQKENCFDHQYSQCSGKEGETISGSIILQDYLADQFGLTVAFKAYENYVEDHEEEEIPLPALNLTIEQLFFLNHAQMICEIGSERFILGEDEEIADLCRIDNVLENMPDFAETFECAEGTAMNPTEKCEIWE